MNKKYIFCLIIVLLASFLFTKEKYFVLKSGQDEYVEIKIQNKDEYKCDVSIKNENEKINDIFYVLLNKKSFVTRIKIKSTCDTVASIGNKIYIKSKDQFVISNRDFLTYIGKHSILTIKSRNVKMQLKANKENKIKVINVHGKINFNFVVKYFIFLIATSLFVLSAYNNFYDEAMHFVKRKKDINIFEKIYNYYNAIDPIYRKSFWIIFVILNIVFLYHTVIFYNGNHCWEVIFDKAVVRFFEGRYNSDTFKYLLNGRYLPIITNLILFFNWALFSVLFCIYFNIQKKVPIITSIGLLYFLQPIMLESLYYMHSQPDAAVSLVAIIVGLIFCEKQDGIKDVKLSIANSIFCILLFNYSLSFFGGYINTIFVLLFGKMFVESFTGKRIQDIIVSKKFSLINIFIGGLSYKIAVSYLVSIGKTDGNMYNVRQLPISLLPARIIDCIRVSIKQLYDYSYPFIPNSITVLFLVIILIAVFYMLFKKKYAALCLLFVCLCATKTSSLIAEWSHFYEPRIDCYSLSLFKLIVFSSLFFMPNIIQSIGGIIASAIIWISVINDAYALSVWKQGLEVEKMLWNRIFYTLEQNDNFLIDNKYRIIQIGEIPNGRKHLYKTKRNERLSLGLLDWSYNHPLYPLHIAEYFYPYTFIDKSKPYMNNLSDLVDLNDKKILSDMKPWPNKSYLKIYKNAIIIVFDGDELNRLKKELNK